MIGKPEWFMPRKFGWGLGIRSWQGAAYIAVATALFLGVSVLPFAQGEKMIALGALAVVFVADVLHIMTQVYSKLDEREEKHQLVAERNASFVGVAGITAFCIYLGVSGAVRAPGFDRTLILIPVAVLVGMALAKGITLFEMERTGQ